MLLLNLIILIFLVFCAYRLIIWSVEAAKIASKQAAYLEQQFGRDVIGAAKYQLGLPGSPDSGDQGPKRQHDDG